MPPLISFPAAEDFSSLIFPDSETFSLYKGNFFKDMIMASGCDSEEFISSKFTSFGKPSTSPLMVQNSIWKRPLVAAIHDTAIVRRPVDVSPTSGQILKILLQLRFHFHV